MILRVMMGLEMFLIYDLMWEQTTHLMFPCGIIDSAADTKTTGLFSLFLRDVEIKMVPGLV